MRVSKREKLRPLTELRWDRAGSQALPAPALQSDVPVYDGKETIPYINGRNQTFLARRIMQTKKICPTCRERPRHRKEGYCLECRRARDRARGSKPERKKSLQQSFAKWWEANGQSTNERHQKWITENADRQRRHRRNWRDRNTEIAVQLVRDWRKNNPHHVARLHSERRAREIGAAGSFTADDIAVQLQRQNNHCYWCDVDMGDAPTVDHFIPLSKGGSNFPHNIVMACSWCNCSKGNKLPDEFRIYLATKRRPT